MADRLLKLGDTTFPVGTSMRMISRGRTIGSAKLARAEGMRQTAGRRNGIECELTVPIFKGPLDTSDFRTRRDALRAMLAVGPARFYAGFDDRYYRCCECRSEPDEILSETGLNRIHAVRLNIVGPDPFEYSTAENTDTWTPTSGVAHSISTIGNASALPEISLTVGGSGLETVAFTVSNDTTGEEFTLAGDVTAGDVIEIDCILKTCKIDDDDRLDLFDGIFLSLSPGANDITISWTSSSVTSATFLHRARFE